MNEPLSPADARKLARGLLEDGRVAYSHHAKARMAERFIDVLDVANVIRGGRYQPAEWEHGSWRYRVLTPRMGVVLSFEAADGELVIVVTAFWRNRR